MKKITLIICTFLFLIFNTVIARAEEKHPIDIFLDECCAAALADLDNPASPEIRSCHARAEEMWTEEMNKYYDLLISELNKQSQEALKVSQEAWEKYRDSQRELRSVMYRKSLPPEEQLGTMFNDISSSLRMHAVRERALELKALYEEYKIIGVGK